MFGFLASLFGQNKASDDFPPKPKWKPNIPVDLATVADRASYYTDHEKAVVIFQNGTCVILLPNSRKPEEEAKAVLNQVFMSHPDFNPQHMDDGNWAFQWDIPISYSVVGGARTTDIGHSVSHIANTTADETMTLTKNQGSGTKAPGDSDSSY